MASGRRREFVRPESQPGNFPSRSPPLMAGASCVLPLRIACEHFNNKVVEAIVELLLENPGELTAFNFTRTEKKNIGVHLRIREAHNE